ncbi:hypothetical protein AKO1_013352 [Acrasis kona]|uniref:BTB domain-containing protein n=1 Tax=Acrasis kona TaxID=1008807 RepID=A0AAW2YYJ9_9EUKA
MSDYIDYLYDVGASSSEEDVYEHDWTPPSKWMGLEITNKNTKKATKRKKKSIIKNNEEKGYNVNSVVQEIHEEALEVVFDEGTAQPQLNTVPNLKASCHVNLNGGWSSPQLPFELTEDSTICDSKDGRILIYCPTTRSNQLYTFDLSNGTTTEVTKFKSLPTLKKPFMCLLSQKHVLLYSSSKIYVLINAMINKPQEVEGHIWSSQLNIPKASHISINAIEDGVIVVNFRESSVQIFRFDMQGSQGAITTSHRRITQPLLMDRNCATSYYNGMLYVGGGTYQNSFCSHFYEYNVSTNVWTKLYLQLPNCLFKLYSCNYGHVVFDGSNTFLLDTATSILVPSVIHNVDVCAEIIHCNFVPCGDKLLVVQNNKVYMLSGLQQEFTQRQVPKLLMDLHAKSKYTNVSLVVGSGESLSVHSGLLWARCPSMYEELRCGDDGYDRRLDLSSFSVHTVKSFIRYLYTGDISVQNVEEFFALICQYSCHKDLILELLCNKMRLEPLLHIHDQYELDLEKLYSSCVNSFVGAECDSSDFNLELLMFDELMAAGRCHIAFLSRSSLVADALTSGMEEFVTKTVRFSDLSIPAMNAILRYLYTDKYCIPLDICVEVFVASWAHNLCDLLDYCRKMIIRNLSIHSVVSIMSIADLYQDVQLRSACIMYYGHHYEQGVTEVEDWQDINEVLFFETQIKYLDKIKRSMKTKIERKPKSKHGQHTFQRKRSWTPW